MKKRSSLSKRASRKSGRVAQGREGVTIHRVAGDFGGVARDALNVFRGGVRVALEGLSDRDVAVMIKTPEGPVVGVPVMENGVFVGMRTNMNSSGGSGSKGAKR